MKSGRFPFSKLAETSMSPPRVSMCFVLAKQPPPVELELLELSTDQPEGSCEMVISLAFSSPLVTLEAEAKADGVAIEPRMMATVSTLMGNRRFIHAAS